MRDLPNARALINCNLTGAIGVSNMFDTIDYLESNDAFTLPIAHTTLLGIFKKLWACFIQEMSST